MSRIYLDYAASAPLAPEAKEAISYFLKHCPVGNPSSLHSEGRAMQHGLDKAHTTLAAILGVQPTEIIFTSGATESNNLALRGALKAWRRAHEGQTPHVVMSALEHPSWYQVVRDEDADITLVSPSKEGMVSAEAVLAALQPTTAIVACMYVNNEVGTVQPVETIGKGVKAYRAQQGTVWPVFHVDAVQAFPYLNTHNGHVHADMLTLSGHKYGGLGGVGVLVVRKGTPVASQQKGGGQEWGLRAGTENVLGAITLAAVAEYCDSHRQKLAKHVASLQEMLEGEIARKVPSAQVLGRDVARVPHITYLWFPEMSDEHLVHSLDLAGIAVSSGAACSSGATLPSSTLLAMGYSETEAYGGIRVSYGRDTTFVEIEHFVIVLAKLIKKL